MTCQGWSADLSQIYILCGRLADMLCGCSESHDQLASSVDSEVSRLDGKVAQLEGVLSEHASSLKV